MKKASVIVLSKDSEAALKELRRLGVMHVEHESAPQGKGLLPLHEDLSLLNNCLSAIGEAGQKKKTCAQGVIVPDDWRATAAHITDLWKRYDQLELFSSTLSDAISAWERWGDFDPNEIRHIRSRGIFIRLYQVPFKQIADFPEGVVVKKVSVNNGIANCIAVSSHDFECVFKEAALPKQSLSEMRWRLAEDKKVAESVLEQVCRAKGYSEGLLKIRSRLEKEIEFYQALAGMGKDGAISYISGYAPLDAAAVLTEAARLNKWGLLVKDPSPDDNVPTLIRNPRWVSLVKPVFKLLEVVPGYRELDISLPFLIFFSVFFGMLIGDAGYGAVYLLLTWFAHRKWGKTIRDKSVFFLFYILSFCAVIWGLLTGTFFGQEWLAGTAYKPLLPALNDTKNIQTFCFFLGALHLSIAHSWRAVLKLPSVTALADMGWVCILWGAFMAARTLILGSAFPVFGKWIILCGIALVVVFTSPQKNILKYIGSGLGTLALSLMNNFTDVVSYVRLFAVGLAGVAIADTFNSMARAVVGENIFTFFIAALILLAGHSLNLMLGPMSVLVHGVRLNVLEFCGHVNVSWSGFPYKPFKE